MPEKARIRAEADRLRAVFEASGAEVVEFDILQPAETLLDLYGEDIRGRAFVTHDPLQGEMMLRPDFTVPLVSRLVREGRREGRFTYAGEVFRRQEQAPDRDAEYLQVGFEIVGGAPAEADAEVFATMADALEPLGLMASMGDIGLLGDAVEGLTASAARKAALRHHLWRPKRFRKLLDAYSGKGKVSAGRRALLDAGSKKTSNAVEIGLRSASEVRARIEALQAEANEPPIPGAEVKLIDMLTGVRGRAPDALSMLADIAVDLPAIEAGVGRLEGRLDALSALGVDVDAIQFDASYGRTSLEYYDGVVFGFSAPARPDLPPVATGGRYDALTRALGDPIPAVGGVIRPGIAIALRAL